MSAGGFPRQPHALFMLMSRHRSKGKGQNIVCSPLVRDFLCGLMGEKKAQQNYGQELVQLCLHRKVHFWEYSYTECFSYPLLYRINWGKLCGEMPTRAHVCSILQHCDNNYVLNELLITFGYTQTCFYLPAAAARWWLCSGVHFLNWPGEGALLGLLKTCLSQSGLKECSVRQHQLQNKENPVDKQVYFKLHFKK